MNFILLMPVLPLVFILLLDKGVLPNNGQTHRLSESLGPQVFGTCMEQDLYKK
jgi:hypothetical protein